MVLVRTAKATEWVEYTGPLYLTDDTPTLCLRFPSGPRPRVKSCHGGDPSHFQLDPHVEPPGAPSDWKWLVLGPSVSIGKQRRVGWFVLELHPPHEVRIELFLDSERIFSAEQFRTMIHEIRAVFPGAVWDLDVRAARASTHFVDRDLKDAPGFIASLLRTLRHEEALAKRFLRRPRWETAPPAPVWRTNTREHFSRTYDLGEQRLIRSWSRRRSLEIDDAIGRAKGERDTLNRQIGSLDAAETQERARREEAAQRFTHWIDELQRMKSRLRAIDTKLSDLGVSLGAGSAYAAGRSAIQALARRRAASAMELREPSGSLVDVGDPPLDEGLALRPMDALYELWFAVACARILGSALGFSLVETPASAGIVPRHVSWTFRCAPRGTLVFECGRLLTMVPASVPSGLRMTQIDAASESIRQRGETGWFTVSTSSTPDYLLRLHQDGAVACSVGDATCTDVIQIQKSSKAGGSVTSKHGIVAGYARNVFWVDEQGRVARSSSGASFVVVPSVNHGVADDPSSPIVLCARPGADAELAEGLETIVASLVYSCSQRSRLGWGAL